MSDIFSAIEGQPIDNGGLQVNPKQSKPSYSSCANPTIDNLSGLYDDKFDDVLYYVATNTGTY